MRIAFGSKTQSENFSTQDAARLTYFFSFFWLNVECRHTHTHTQTDERRTKLKQIPSLNGCICITVHQQRLPFRLFASFLFFLLVLRRRDLFRLCIADLIRFSRWLSECVQGTRWERMHRFDLQLIVIPFARLRNMSAAYHGLNTQKNGERITNAHTTR